MLHKLTFAILISFLSKVTWMMGNRVMDESGRFKLKNEGNRSYFEIPAAIATDSGTYTVEANNQKGAWTSLYNLILCS